MMSFCYLEAPEKIGDIAVQNMYICFNKKYFENGIGDIQGTLSKQLAMILLTKCEIITDFCQMCSNFVYDWI